MFGPRTAKPLCGGCQRVRQHRLPADALPSHLHLLLTQRMLLLLLLLVSY